VGKLSERDVDLHKVKIRLEAVDHLLQYRASIKSQKNYTERQKMQRVTQRTFRSVGEAGEETISTFSAWKKDPKGWC